MSARKRRRIVDDEEEVEDMTMRLRARKKHQVRHNDDDDDDDDDDDEDLDGEQQGHSSQNTHTSRTPEKNLTGNILPVTCGDKKGMLDASKLAKGEECIECEGLWFTPQAFEKHGGKSSSKKWKHSILYRNQHLQVLFESDVLTTPGYGNKGTHTEKKIQESESSSEESEPLEESVDRENSWDDDWLPDSLDMAQEQVEQRSQGSQTDRGEDRWFKPENGLSQRKPDDGVSVGVPEEEGGGRSSISGHLDLDLNQQPSGFQADAPPTEPLLPTLLPGRKTRRCLKVSLQRVSEDQTAHHPGCSEPPGVGLVRSSPTAPDRESCGEEEHRSTSADRQSGDSGDATETASTHTHTANNLTLHPPDLSGTSRSKETSEETSRESRLPRSPVVSCGRETDAPATRSDVDAMSLRELKEEKLKMQLKVLRLQEEYYSIQIQKHKQ